MLEPENKTIVPVPTDGNCLLHAIVMGLGVSDQSMHLRIRNLIADTIEKDHTYFEPWIVGDFDQLINSIRQPGVWLGEIAIRAIVRAFALRIVVLQIGTEPIVYSPDTTSSSMPRTIELAYLNNSHYDLVVMRHVAQDIKPSLPPFTPIQLSELLEATLTNELSTCEWIINQHFLRPSISCWSCKGLMPLHLTQTGAQLGTYYCSLCERRVSVRSTCFLRHVRLPIHRVIKICLGWLTGKTGEVLKEETATSKRSISRLTNVLNVSASILMTKKVFKLGGIGKCVEVDEANLPRSKYHVGRSKPDCWVLGMVERPTSTDPPRAIFLSVAERNAQTLTELISNWVEPGTTIITDGWAGYANLNSVGFIHRTVNHSEHFVNPGDQAHTQRIESLWSWVRRKGIPTSGCSAASVDYYLHAFNYRRLNGGNIVQFFKDLFSLTHEELHVALSAKKATDTEHRASVARVKAEEAKTVIHDSTEEEQDEEEDKHQDNLIASIPSTPVAHEVFPPNPINSPVLDVSKPQVEMQEEEPEAVTDSSRGTPPPLPPRSPTSELLARTRYTNLNKRKRAARRTEKKEQEEENIKIPKKQSRARAFNVADHVEHIIKERTRLALQKQLQEKAKKERSNVLTRARAKQSKN